MTVFYLIVYFSSVLCIQSTVCSTVATQSSSLDRSPPIVTTKYGRIEGTFDGVSRTGRHFYQFRGIQYAQVKERFKPSVPVKPWNGIKSAKTFGPTCFYKDDKQPIKFDENCLMLNIYTPSINPSNTTLLLPVVVYIHGGSFQWNSGADYGPNYLLDEDIIMVTINYRLGILGFLSTGDEASSGNYGLKDQVMALRWVQENIQVFGGDRNKVTIMGQSAGSASVTYHLVSPLSKGLFRHAIAQSGTFLGPWAFVRKPVRYAKQLAQHFKCKDTTNTIALVECLKKIDAKTLASREIAGKVTHNFFEDPVAAFGPTLEPLVGDGSSTFLSVSPYKLLAMGNVTKVPLLTGVVEEEGIYVWAALILLLGDDVKLAVDARQKLQTNFAGVAPTAFYFDEKAPAEKLQQISKKVEEFYFGTRGFRLDDNTTFPQLSHLYSDRLLLSSAVRFMNLYSRHAPTYPYLYTFNKFAGLEFGWDDLHKNYSLKATHGADLDMIISPLLNKTRANPVHDKISKSVTKLWASFIREGVPSATYGSEQNFPAISPNVGLQNWYKLDIDTALSTNIFSERVKFWESLELSDDDFDNCYC